MAFPATLLGCSSKDHFEDARVCIHIFNSSFNRPEITGRKDIDELTSYLQEQKISIRSKSTNMALVLTFNEYTKYWVAHLFETWRNAGIGEFVIFKDPSRAPYLCDYPSLQKGFKRPPP
jgi:hypothetical protein